MNSLFGSGLEEIKPLAYRLRPKTLEKFIGQKHLLREESILKKLLNKKKMVNSIFYGPPGTGKTSLAFIIAEMLDCEFIPLNATNSGVAQIKKTIDKAKELKLNYGKHTVLFLDEIHRFNKSQQDSLLEYTENGVITLIGATTENPYYNLNNALISRCMLFEFKELNLDDINDLLISSAKTLKLDIDKEILDYLISLSNGDGRTALNYLELLNEIKEDLSFDDVKILLGDRKKNYHKTEDKYNIISAFIKSIRGSDPDSAVYWLGRMLDGGEDPKYIARRLMVHASEDIGMANPEALTMATNAMVASEKIGMPEVRIILSHVTIYLAISSKSSSCYDAIAKVYSDIDRGIINDVPFHLSTLGEHKYKYPHSFEESFVKQEYNIPHKRYYLPKNNKFELKIEEKLNKLWGYDNEDQ